MKRLIKKVSVILPTYNNAEYLKTSVKSILNQTFRDFEFLIIDDGSGDNTEEVVNSFNDSRICYIKKEHSGVGDTYNLGIAKSTYDWIARMDSDDIALPTRLEEQINYLNETEYNFIACWYAVFCNNKIQYLVKPSSDDRFLKSKLLLHTGVINAGSMFNRNIIPPEGFINDVHEDHEMFLRIRSEIKMSNVNKVLMLMRYRKNSYSRSSDQNYNLKMYHVVEKYFSEPVANQLGIKTKKEFQELRGWREYFYGDKSKARKIWIENFLLFQNIKIVIAFVFSYLPYRFLNKLKEFRIRFRINYYLSFFSQESILIRKLFKEITK